MRLALVCVVFVSLLTACTTPQMVGTAERMRSDPSLQAAARQLARDYLDGQIRGESAEEARAKYGATSSFYNLSEYRLGSFSVKQEGPRFLKVRIKAGSRVGVPTWTDTEISFVHDPAREAQGDRYRGLRIASVTNLEGY